MARRCWLVRADQGDALAGVFESTGTVALGGAPGPADLTGLGHDEIVELIRPTQGRDDEAAADAGRLVKFRDDMRHGDIVVTVDGDARQLLIGEVTGDYEYRADQPTGDRHHVRAVEWYGRYGRDDRGLLSEEMAKRTGLEAALVELTPTEAWLKLAGGVRERPALARARSLPRAAPKAAARPRPSRAAVAPPKPVPPAHRVCPECKYQKAHSQFRAGSDHCVDCRDKLGED